MIRVVVYLVAIIALSLLAVWFAQHPGTVTIQWEGMRIDTSLAVMGLGVLVLALVLAMIIRFWGWLVSRPRKIAEARAAERRRHGYRALTHGLVAAAAGDTGTARKAAKTAEGLLGEPPLTMLLAAQAAQLDGDDAAAEQQFKLMLENSETEFLGIRGLMVQAEKRGDHEAARQLAERAFKIRPETPWVQRHLLELETTSGEWSSAMRTVDAAVKAGTLTHEEGRRRRAIYLYQQALEAEQTGDHHNALRLARDAHDRQPNFVPATILGARLLAEENKRRQAARLIETSWTNGPHPRLAALYGGLDGDDPMKRLKRLEQLVKLAPSAVEGRVAAAESALAGEMWGKAREHLEAAADIAPTNRVYRLLAQLEEAEHGDGEAAREWLLKASMAPPDPAWVCGRCGHVDTEWTLACGNCGAIDSLAWRSPPSSLLALEAPPAAAAGAIEHAGETAEAEQAGETEEEEPREAPAREEILPPPQPAESRS